MSLYRPAAFASDDQAAIARLFDEHPFATLITTGAGDPQISHLPLLRESAPGAHGSLIGHMARANPHWSHFDNGASLAIFHGPHAYVSPSWYAQPAVQVPTWNYAVVHVHGRAEIVADRAATLAILQKMVARFEGSRAAPWSLQLEGARLDAMVGAIVAFRIQIERIEAKFKLSQNRDEADRRRVAAALRSETYADATATADWMDREAGSG
ncbi:MAG TPA: FMN-binding negative transcriptional regulator [Casimicrobiaceae bacterium]|jgi:transcriptional regulator|nr:FMN-binding negative transcriptional regulator [Casimicrobiaceae bacterium]